MAIISIPTSIGGVSVPGAAIKGPLGKLFGNNSQITNLHYPRDLGSKTRGHVVQFTINEVKPVGYEENKEYNISDAYKAATNTVDDVGTKAYNAYKSASGAVDSVLAGTKAGIGAISETINLRLKDRKKEIKAAINLYMPDSLEFTNSAGYSNLSLKDVAEEVIKSTAGKIPYVSGAINTVTSIADSNAMKLALSTQGFAINPQQQLLFDGIDFRTFQMAFTFTPFSKDEADTVKEIIKMFKTHSAPRIVNGSGGMFFIPPSTFNMQFLFDGSENTNIPKVAECVIESIDVNYAPNGWSAHTDGAPVQTTMTVSFKEIELITSDKISKDGY